MFKTLAVVLAVSALLGCASVEPEKLSQIKVNLALSESVDFTWIDQRPIESKQSRTDPSVGSGNQLYLLGDDRLTPAPSELTRGWLQQKAGKRLSGRKVTLEEFELRIFDPSVSVDQERLFVASASVPGGLLAAPFAGALIHGIEKMRREINTNLTIRIKVNGDEYTGSSVKSFRGRVSEQDLATTVELALDDLATQVANSQTTETDRPSAPAR